MTLNIRTCNADDAPTTPEKPEVVHIASLPGDLRGRVEVYGLVNERRFDWRIIDARGDVVLDTGLASETGQQYTSADMALSSAMHHVKWTDIEDRRELFGEGVKEECP